MGAHNEERRIDEVDTHRTYRKTEGQINNGVNNLLQVCESWWQTGFRTDIKNITLSEKYKFLKGHDTHKKKMEKKILSPLDLFLSWQVKYSMIFLITKRNDII